MTADVIVRPLEPQHYKDVRRIYLEYRASEGDWDTSTPEQQAYLLRDTDPRALDVYRRSGCSFVAELGGRVVGYVIAYLVERGVALVVGVRSIFVAPEYRRRGIATNLYEALREAATTGEIDHVFTDVSPDNQPSIGLHQKVGFGLHMEINARLNISPVRRSFLD